MSPLIVGSGSSGSEGRSDRFGLPTGTSDPGTAEAGDLYYKTDTNKIRVYDGGAWADLASGGGGGSTAASIDNSVRFDSTTSSHLSRTLSSDGNRKTWTWSGWVKRSKLGISNSMFGAFYGSSSRYLLFRFQPDDSIYIFGGNYTTGSSTGTNFSYITSSVYRDPSAWYHLVLVYDTTQAVEADRVRLYVNNEQVTNFSSSAGAAQDSETFVNAANSTHHIGQWGENLQYFDGYIADVNFIDGSALAPTAFGAPDSTTGVWNPIQYTGSYPGNSFHLDFSTNDIGNDVSGNNNDWTANNFTLSTGAYIGALSSSGLKTPAGGFVKPFNDGRSEGTGGLTFTPPTPISYTTSVEVYDNNNVTRSQVNSGSFVQHAPNAWVTVASGSGTINSMFFQRTDNNAFDAGFYAIRVDGEILYDSIESSWTKDSPTNGTASTGGDPGGSVVANYAVLNPINTDAGAITFSNGNLSYSNPSGSGRGLTTISMRPGDGKFYCEWVCTSTVLYNHPGIFADSVDAGTDTNRIVYRQDGNVYTDLSQTATIASFTKGDVIGMAFDADTRQLTYYKNGTSVGGPYQASTPPNGGGYYFHILCNAGCTGIFNFGQNEFSYTTPALHKSLNTANLPTPSILNGSEYMDVLTYTGNSGTNLVSGAEFSPDIVWIKRRDVTTSHLFYDRVRGSGATAELIVNANSTEGSVTDTNAAAFGYLNSYDANGFTVQAGTSNGVYTNQLNSTYAAWIWNAGGSTVTNTNGSVPGGSLVRAQPSSGCSIVVYTGTGGNITVGHGLNAAPGFIIIKNRDTALGDPWRVWHSSLAANERLVLSGTNVIGGGPTLWQNTAPSSTVFYLDGDSRYNTNGDSHVAYCFAPIKGYSSFGSWDNNNSASGAFVYLGFRPRYILLKNTDNVERWYIMDSARHTYNVPPADATKLTTTADPEGAQAATTATIDFLSNGFKIRTTNTAGGEISFGTRNYVYAAWAENPFSIARAR